MVKMKIPLKNQKLEIRLSISVSPNLKKLEKELEDFFAQNEVEGHKIKKFRIETSPNMVNYEIIPLEPPLDESLSAKGGYEEKIKKIGEEYGIKDLGFIYWCYHK